MTEDKYVYKWMLCNFIYFIIIRILFFISSDHWDYYKIIGTLLFVWFIPFALISMGYFLFKSMKQK